MLPISSSINETISVFNSVSVPLDQQIRKANDKIEKLVNDVPNLNFTDDDLGTPKDEFIKAVSQFTKLGASMGALASSFATLPSDAIVGRGSMREMDLTKNDKKDVNKWFASQTDDGQVYSKQEMSQTENKDVLDQGVLGRLAFDYCVKATIGCDLVGYALGAGCGVLAKSETLKKYGEEGQVVGRILSLPTSTITPLALSALRLPSLAVKFAGTGLGAIAFGGLGLFVGAARALRAS